MRQFKLPGLRVWLEILSIGDRADGLVDCMSVGAQLRLTSASETKKKTVSGVVEWLHNHDCLVSMEGQNHISQIVNYAEYHRTWEQKKIPSKNKACSSPNLTRPNQTYKEEKKKPEAVDNSKEELKVIFDLVKTLAGGSTHRLTDIRNWIGKTIRESQEGVDKAKPELTRQFILQSMQSLKKLGVGNLDREGIFAYLTGAFKKIRTETLQKESEKYKQGGIENAGEILRRMKGDAQ